MDDLMRSGSTDDDDGGEVESHSVDGSNYSDSVMFSGLSTDSTTDLTIMDALSIQTTDSPGTPVYGDHGAVTGLAPGTFIEIYREHLARASHQEDDASEVSEFGGTIVSSAPSGTNIEPPPLEGSWHMNSPPRIIHRENMSISTTESMYRELASLHNEHDDEDSSSVDTSFLSLQPSMIESSVYSNIDASSSCTTPSERYRRATSRHENSSFVNVADRLALQHVREDKSCEWFSRFTEQDWLAFHRDAKMLLTAMNPGSDLTALPLPPPAPRNVSDAMVPVAPYCAAESLPDAFICGLCHDVIVGAALFDCSCLQSAVCMICWESHHTTCVDDDELEDLVLVVHNKACPFCEKTNCRAVPCHALDVAILHCVKAMSDNHPVQTAYYRRLTVWRDEVQRRRSECQHDVEEQDEEVLAEMIRQEEEYFWKKEKTNSFWNNNKRLLFALAGELALLAAAAALTGSGVMRGTLLTRR